MPEGEKNGVVPVPLSVTDCGEVAALSVIDTLALRLPVAVGLKITEMVHEAVGTMFVPRQVVVVLKSPLLVPLRVTAVIVSGPVPALLMVMVWLALGVLVF